MKVLVIGLNPSRLGKNSSAIRNLYKWLDELNVKVFSFTNLYEGYEIDETRPQTESIREFAKSYDKILALGKVVSLHLDHLEINHFSLPHPSGLNRQLNDQKFIDERLEACKNYLEGL